MKKWIQGLTVTVLILFFIAVVFAVLLAGSVWEAAEWAWRSHTIGLRDVGDITTRGFLLWLALALLVKQRV